MRKKSTRGLLAILLGLLLPPPPAVFAQQAQPLFTNTLPRYEANYSVSLSSAASLVTVQATATSAPVSFEEADIYCSVPCVATTYINGTPATTTSLAVTGPIGVTAAQGGLPSAFSASNVGGGTALKSFNIAAGQTLTLSLAAFYLPPGAGSKSNLSIGIASITGTATIQIQWIAQ